MKNFKIAPYIFILLTVISASFAGVPGQVWYNEDTGTWTTEPFLTTYHADYFVPNEVEHVWSYQWADVAGFGRAIGQTDDALVIDVEHLWTGSFATNPVAISGAFESWSDGVSRDHPGYYGGKTIVFFATTNLSAEESSSVPISFPSGRWRFDVDMTFTNAHGYCPPRFTYPLPPTWYAIETNDTEHLSFFSNIVNSIVVRRDLDLFYATLRDAVKPDGSGDQPFKAMSHATLMELTWTSSESNLVTMVNDPLLFPTMRRHALFQLKKHFNWPATNTIPEL